MKNRMPTRKSVGKVSTYLRNKGFNNVGQSEFRASRRKSNEKPNSTKQGKKPNAFKRMLRILSK